MRQTRKLLNSSLFQNRQSIVGKRNILNVASRLYNRAIGYSCKATKFATSDGRITDQKEYIEHYPPDTTAAIFWLKNRQPEKWRDRKEVDTNVNLGDELESMTDEQLIAIIRGEQE